MRPKEFAAVAATALMIMSLASPLASAAHSGSAAVCTLTTWSEDGITRWRETCKHPKVKNMRLCYLVTEREGHVSSGIFVQTSFKEYESGCSEAYDTPFPPMDTPKLPSPVRELCALMNEYCEPSDEVKGTVEAVCRIVDKLLGLVAATDVPRETL